MYRCRIDARKFKFKRLTEGYQPGAPSCKNENINLTTDPLGILRLWRKHFFILLQGDDDAKPPLEMVFRLAMKRSKLRLRGLKQ